MTRKAKSIIRHRDITDSELFHLIKRGTICLGGNRRLKIYGRLACWSGKRMKKENRVFFSNEQEARENGYRPCGHCMKRAYEEYKNQFTL